MAQQGHRTVIQQLFIFSQIVLLPASTGLVWSTVSTDASAAAPVAAQQQVTPTRAAPALTAAAKCGKHWAAWWQEPPASAPTSGCPGKTGWNVSGPFRDAPGGGKLCVYDWVNDPLEEAPVAADSATSFRLENEPACKPQSVQAPVLLAAQASTPTPTSSRGDGGFPQKIYYRAGKLLMLVSSGVTKADARLTYSGGYKDVTSINVIPGVVNLVPVTGLPSSATVSRGTLKWTGGSGSLIIQ